VKSNLIKSLITLILLGLFLVGYSFYINPNTSYMGYYLKNPFYEVYLDKPLEKLICLDIDLSAEYKKLNTKDSLARFDTLPQRILMFGESMTEGLHLRLREYAKANGHYLRTVTWYSSTTKLWSQKDTIPKLIEKYNPTFLIVSIGSNELYYPNIRKTRVNQMTKIYNQIKDYNYVWVGPPVWDKDMGMCDLILDFVPKNRYFNSRDLTLQRGKDGAHPTFPAAAIWCDTLISWMNIKHPKPIKLIKPENIGK
jgi:hypothetical protein